MVPPVGLRFQEAASSEDAEEHHFVNWSNTHEAFPKHLYEPQTEDELQAIVANAHRRGKLRFSTVLDSIYPKKSRFFLPQKNC